MALGDYNSGTLKDGQIRISPSQVNMLIQNDGAWFEYNVLRSKKHELNCSMNLGTVTHYYIEKYIKGEFEPSEGEIIDWLDSVGEIDQWRVLDNSKKMYKCFKDNWSNSSKVLSEHWMEFEPSDLIKVSGTADIIIGDTILDVKTSSTEKYHLKDYLFQLYTLAYIARMNGMDINNVGIINLVEPTEKVTTIRAKSPYKSKIYLRLENIVNERMVDEGLEVTYISRPKYKEIIEPIDENKMNELLDLLKKKAKKIKIGLKMGDNWDIIFNHNPLTYLQ